MKDKVGILTTYFATNFGAMLQAYALKKYIESLNFDVEMIRYKQRNIYAFYNPWRPYVFTRFEPRVMLGYIRQLPGLIKRDRAFKKFMYNYINHEKGFVDSIPEDKDFYIVGSDQIWNPKHTNGFDDVYFGCFKTKSGAIKASYAASAECIDYSREQIDYLKEKLSNFDYISVREKMLEQNLSMFFMEKKITTVLDPTMLLSAEDYKNISFKHPCPNKKFAYFYALRDSFRFIDKFYYYVKKRGWELVISSEMPDKSFRRYASTHSGVTYLPYSDIETFLGAVKNANIIFTSSFHGSVFSILFHKQFYTLQLNDDKMTRPTNLLEMLNLKERLLSLDSDISDEMIDYVQVDKNLNGYREQSRSFLKKVFNIGE